MLVWLGMLSDILSNLFFPFLLVYETCFVKCKAKQFQGFLKGRNNYEVLWHNASQFKIHSNIACDGGLVVHTLSNFESRRDVPFCRLHISGEVPLNECVVYGIAAKHACFMVTCGKVQSIGSEITSNLKLEQSVVNFVATCQDLFWCLADLDIINCTVQ